ncbi:MAG TPA: NUDIX hydrolase [Herpetosiphonaceae bacterium]
MLDPTIEREIAELGQRYGSPLRRPITLDDRLFDPLGKSDRYGEVCMVLRRRSGLLLTARKTYYPPDAYRLLTGGIHHGEPILEALLRETEEETGLHVEVRRFLAAITYYVPPHPEAQSGPISFHTFAFLLDEVGGTLGCVDPDERVADFREVAVAELPRLAQRLEQLRPQFDPEINGRWSDWGRFRAAIHHAVHEALTQSS